MNYNHTFGNIPHVNQPYEGNPYYWNPYHAPSHETMVHWEERQQMVHGQATWTVGGQETKCGIPWSRNQYMTAAVGETSPFTCGQIVKVRNLQNGREISVMIVDEVRGFPANRINLHRRAFEALGADLNMGILNVGIEQSTGMEQGRFVSRLEGIVQTVYPNALPHDFQSVETLRTETGHIKEVYDFVMNSNGEESLVRGEIVYLPNTDHIVSLYLEEK